MIQANDLRLKNIVSYEGKQYSIHSLTPEYPYLDTIEFGQGVVEYKDLEGVKLTEDIVSKIIEVKNFGINYNGGTININTQSYLIVRIFMGTWNVYIKCNNSTVAEYINVSLHQLQNLFYSLTGKELNYKP